jgi:hypothetical protein
MSIKLRMELIAVTFNQLKLSTGKVINKNCLDPKTNKGIKSKNTMPKNINSQYSDKTIKFQHKRN